MKENKAEFKNKFLIINHKRFEELNDATEDYNKEVRALQVAIDNFKIAYEKRVGKKLDQKYFVCNQDEPYAQDVIDVILRGECEKESK